MTCIYAIMGTSFFRIQYPQVRKNVGEIWSCLIGAGHKTAGLRRWRDDRVLGEMIVRPVCARAGLCFSCTRMRRQLFFVSTDQASTHNTSSRTIQVSSLGAPRQLLVLCVFAWSILILRDSVSYVLVISLRCLTQTPPQSTSCHTDPDSLSFPSRCPCTRCFRS